MLLEDIQFNKEFFFYSGAGDYAYWKIWDVRQERVSKDIPLN